MANAAWRVDSSEDERPLLDDVDDVDGYEDDEIAIRPPTKETPIPWGQFSLVLFLQLSEPLTSQVIYPFVPQLIREIGITDGDETRVGYYVGLMVRLLLL